MIADTPRHVLVPRWLEPDGTAWTVIDGPDKPARWARAAYANTQSLVTRVGALHADHADPGTRAHGAPTSSSTNPWLVLTMYRHAQLYPGMDVLDVGTGSGYGCALLARLLGERAVTSVDVDPYLVRAARERLAQIGVRPRVEAVDATGPLGWKGDRIVSMVGVPHVPAAWLAALRPGGRLVTTLAGTMALVTARRTEDGGAWGQIEADRAGFMPARTGPDHEQPATAPPVDADGQETRSPYPVVDLGSAAGLRSMLAVAVPGVECGFAQVRGLGSGWLAHPDGSWARAAGPRGEPAVVRQGGPRRLWDELDRIRAVWLEEGSLPLFGAEVRVAPDGTTVLSRGLWRAVLGPGAGT